MHFYDFYSYYWYERQEIKERQELIISILPKHLKLQVQSLLSYVVLSRKLAIVIHVLKWWPKTI